MLRVRPSHSLLQERLKTQTWRWGQINPKSAKSHFPQHPENLLLTAKAPLPSSQRRRRHLQVVAVVDGAGDGDGGGGGSADSRGDAPAVASRSVGGVRRAGGGVGGLDVGGGLADLEDGVTLDDGGALSLDGHGHGTGEAMLVYSL